MISLVKSLKIQVFNEADTIDLDFINLCTKFDLLNLFPSDNRTHITLGNTYDSILGIFSSGKLMILLLVDFINLVSAFVIFFRNIKSVVRFNPVKLFIKLC